MKNTNDDVKICCICGKNYIGYGNNAEPVAEGRCCDRCNDTVVFLARIKELNKRAKEVKENEKAKN